MKAYIDKYLQENEEIIKRVDREKIQMLIAMIRQLKINQGRLFILGVGGSAANASHAVNDFRKITGIETYAPTDNVSELTAWTNDNGFEYVFVNWLKTSHLGNRDAILIFSVGGGSKTTSRNLVLAMDYAKDVGAHIFAIVSRDGGYAAKVADVCVRVPVICDERITPHAEAWQGVLWHLIVNAIS